MEEIERDLFEYIELFYNRKRLHATLGYLSEKRQHIGDGKRSRNCLYHDRRVRQQELSAPQCVGKN